MTRLEALTALKNAVEAGSDDLDILASLTAADLMFGHAGRYVYAIDAYRGSLDAARDLHKAVLPGWTLWSIMRVNNQTCYVKICNISKAKGSDLSPAVRSESHCPAQAWLLAILAALIAQEQSE